MKHRLLLKATINFVFYLDPLLTRHQLAITVTVHNLIAQGYAL
jgi:hypothetical protein